jgi:hypothetical protein
MTSTDMAVVVLAHTDPAHLSRLVRALAPIPVFTHCDSRTDEHLFGAMKEATRGENVEWIARRPTPWGSWNAVLAEADAIEAALHNCDPSYVAVLQGSDYPLTSTPDLRAQIGLLGGRSALRIHPLPYSNWGPTGGFDRIRYTHYRRRKLPIPRRLPSGLRYAGAAVQKVLSRSHCEAILGRFRSDPTIPRLFRRSHVPDETCLPTALYTEVGAAIFDERAVLDRSLWYMDWSRGGTSPAWLNDGHLEDLLAAATGDHAAADPRTLFARKYQSGRNSRLLDRIDDELRRVEAG